jgi:hypothetical protein
MKPFDLNWGEVTPEGFNREMNQALHVFNFSMNSAENRQLALIFLIGRVIWFHKHLPPGCSQRVRVDVCGQYVSDEALDEWREIALTRVKHEVPNLNLSIEFLVD